MKKQLSILLAGALVVVPFVLTIYVIVGGTLWLDDKIRQPLIDEGQEIAQGMGVVIAIGVLYLVGLLTKFWLFRGFVSLLETMVSHVPGVKTIYESVRDLLKLFGGDTRKMGRSVLYNPQGSDMTMLAILTNEHPGGVSPLEDKVAIFLPYSYMFGGITIYVPRTSISEIPLPVDQTLKLCATAQVTESVAKD